MKKKILSLIAVGVLAAGLLAGCGGNANESGGDAQKEGGDAPAVSAQEEEAGGTEDAGGAEKKDGKFTIGYTYYYSSEFITLMNQGVQEKCDELGLDVIMLDAENDSSNQITQVENLIAQKVDCLYIAAVDSDAIVPAIDMAKEANIPLVAVNMTINTDEDYYYSGPDDVLAGKLEMESAIEAIGGKGNVCILEGPIGQSAQIDRLEGNKQALAENPDIEVVADQTANWSREEAQDIVDSWLQAFEIDAIVAHNDEMALGAIMAIQSAGLTPGEDIIVTGVDAIEDGCNAVKDGTLLSTVYQDAKLEGGQGIELCNQILNGETPEKFINLIDMTQYTKDNVQELIDELYS
ncbi:MAG: sugar ABC transporter substrate-binding protein [Eubacterium sp.]|jgi:ABC-type sugar transport system, periplasmic component|nr:sugar ABC transporter substrate-binding protein [Eubacterium sp.]